jgi:4-carboxymuconolactone decarboxylase
MKDYIDNSDVAEKNLKYLMENHGEIYETYQNFGKLIHEKGGPLDEKTRWLIKIALSTCSQYQYALKTHILKALKAGCSKEEIEHVILLTAPTCGFPTMMEGILILRDVMEEAK